MPAPTPELAPPIRNSYWVLPGKVLAGEHPCGTSIDATRERLDRLLQAGVECFIDLTEPNEVRRYDSELPFGIEYLRKPIKDHGIPGQRGHMAEILDCLHDAMRSGRCVYVHCRAGIGRTGTVIGCFLAERGLTGEAALDELNRLWQQCERARNWASVPETDDQVKYVRRWKARGVFDDNGQLKTADLEADDASDPALSRGGGADANANANTDGIDPDDGAAPWAHLLIDEPPAGAPIAGFGRGNSSRRAGRKATGIGSSGSTRANPAAGRGARPPGGGAARVADGGGAVRPATGGEAQSPRGSAARHGGGSTVAPVSGRTAQLPGSGGVQYPGDGTVVHPDGGATQPPGDGPGRQAGGAPARQSGAVPQEPATSAAASRGSPASGPAAPSLFADPASVAREAIAASSGTATTPTRVEGVASPDATALDGVDDVDPLLDPEALAAASHLRARFLGALLGLATGDAVAAATQFRRPGSFTPVGDMLGGGPFDLPRGAWSDDTAMTLCLAESLLESNGFDARDQVDRYRRWQQEGYLSATGQCVGITASSARAIAMAQWRRQAFAGSHDPAQLDPEPLSRVAAAVLFFFASSGQAIDQATEAARTTCQAPAVLDACRSLARALHAALSGQPKATVLEMAAVAGGAGPGRGSGPAAGAPAGTPGTSLGAAPGRGADVRTGSSASGALAAAVAAFGATDNFRDAILYAVNLGGDSDVVAAVCGQLAGAYYGVKAIPTSWYNGLIQKELVISYADRLLARALLGLSA